MIQISNTTQHHTRSVLSMADRKVNSKTLVCVLLHFILICTAVADDAAFMSQLFKALSPTPSGWSGTSFCHWSGVKCSANRVTSINLASQKLSGTLPSDLNSLSQLTLLSLQGNEFSGALPSVANLSTLETVVLDGNNFTSVPEHCFEGLTSLQILSMTDTINLAPWTFPTELTQSSNLVKLDLGNANLVGSLPDIFDSFVSLTELRLSYNNLTGGLPKTFAGSGIQNLWLNNQHDGFGFSGTIELLASMTHLSQVWLHKNQFTGPIPDLSNCTTLFDLQLTDNQLTGIVPPSLMSLSSLQNVSLGNNVLQGPVPSFGKGVMVTLDGINSFCQKSAGPCDSRVNILLNVAKDFGYPLLLARSWTGNDPCGDWRFIVCAEGKIISVNLAEQNLNGTISPAFANLTDLRNLYLNDNNLAGSIPGSLANLTDLRNLYLNNNFLVGSIPGSLANLTYLRNLYLNNNNLGGSIPGSLTSLALLEVLDVSNNHLLISGDVPKFSSMVRFSYIGNHVLLPSGGGGGRGTIPSKGSGDAPSGSPNAGSSGSSLSSAWIVGIVVIAVFFVALVVFVFCKCHAKKLGWKVRKDGKGGVQSFEMSIQVLRQVTNNFSDDNILGRGGFGVVYKGELHDGSKIAVKRMQSGAMGSKGVNEFQAEITFFSKVRHRHLVTLLGYCINSSERILVYEYMPQGTLTQHLFYWRKNCLAPLTWKQRVTIALDVARGVEYLHSLAQEIFIHRDLKPSNILLSDDMRAKVADFGLVKNAPDGKDYVSTRMAGTFGYLPPEYAATGRVTTKVDVYAFGIVLMELITGRKALDNTLPEEMAHLVSWFRRILINMENVTMATDQTLNLDEETMESFYKVVELAGHCTAPEPLQRPDMGHAVNVLVPLVKQWNPTCGQEEKECYDMINEGTMSFSEIQSGR